MRGRPRTLLEGTLTLRRLKKKKVEAFLRKSWDWFGEEERMVSGVLMIDVEAYEDPDHQKYIGLGRLGQGSTLCVSSV